MLRRAQQSRARPEPAQALPAVGSAVDAVAPATPATDPVQQWIQQTWGGGTSPLPTLGELIGQQQSVEARNREAVAKQQAMDEAKSYIPLVAAVGIGVLLLVMLIRR